MAKAKYLFSNSFGKMVRLDGPKMFIPNINDLIFGLHVLKALITFKKIASHGKFGFSRPDLERNKLSKGMCLVRKVRDRELFI